MICPLCKEEIKEKVMPKVSIYGRDKYSIFSCSNCGVVLDANIIRKQQEG